MTSILNWLSRTGTGYSTMAKLNRNLAEQHASIVSLAAPDRFPLVKLLNISILGNIVASAIGFVYAITFMDSTAKIELQNVLRAEFIIMIPAILLGRLIWSIVTYWIPRETAISHKGLLLFRRYFSAIALTDFLPWESVTVIGTGLPRSDKISIRIITTVGGSQTNRMFALDSKKVHNLTRFAEALRVYAPREKIAHGFWEQFGLESPTAFTVTWNREFIESSQELAKNKSESLILNGRYRLQQEIGSGGQGTAYLAIDESFATLHRSAGSSSSSSSSSSNSNHSSSNSSNSSSSSSHFVVLKEFVLPAVHAGSVEVSRSIQSIRDEFDLLAQIDSPNIVKVIDFFVVGGNAYLVLEHIPGRSLRSLVATQGALTESNVCRLAEKMCDVLEHLHKRSPVIVHRDFTPDNLILTEDNRLCLIDFNVAQSQDRESSKAIVGRKSYVAPEQLQGLASPGSDIYSMGATLYFLAVGRDPEPLSSSEPNKSRNELSDDFNLLVQSMTMLSIDERLTTIDEIRRLLYNCSVLEVQ